MAHIKETVPIMRALVAIFFIGLLSPVCHSKPAEETESVVSVYTTMSTTAGTSAPLDVYHQIANNIAERITSPIYRFLGINKTKEETTKPSNIELQDDKGIINKDVKPVDNELPPRDVEEISNEATKKDRKPEKIILYSSYLPTNGKLELNDTNDIDSEDPFTLDDVDEDLDSGKGSREGPFVFFIELFGSLWQLFLGAVYALFRPPSSDSR